MNPRTYLIVFVWIVAALASGCDTRPHYYPAPPLVVAPGRAQVEPAYYPPPVVISAPPAIYVGRPPVVYPAPAGRVERSVAPVPVINPSAGVAYPTTAPARGMAPTTTYTTKAPASPGVLPQPPVGGTLTDRSGMMTEYRPNTGPAPIPATRAQATPSYPAAPQAPARPVTAPPSVARPSFVPSAAPRPTSGASWGRPASSPRR